MVFLLCGSDRSESCINHVIIIEINSFIIIITTGRFTYQLDEEREREATILRMCEISLEVYRNQS